MNDRCNYHVQQTKQLKPIQHNNQIIDKMSNTMINITLMGTNTEKYNMAYSGI